MIPSIVVLVVIAVVAIVISYGRVTDSTLIDERKQASRMLAIMIVLQSIHFLEEWKTGFYEQFGPLFGQDPMTETIFVTVNIVLIVVWIACMPGLRRGVPATFTAVWFLAIAGVLNGIAHPVLAIVSRGYFPGLITSPVVAVGGYILIQKLIEASRTKGSDLPDN